MVKWSIFVAPLKQERGNNGKTILSELEQLVMWKVISYHIFEDMLGMPQTAENNENIIINTLDT